ncbi:hypothetical protein BRADI_5g14846v3 [Brachypodium distachyon]|uniref:Uncharacterized protein n=1 Tax=Brachypodium distachyon TaxID=15368 RepID=A0A2K2CH91_BRADI|nr:hypothetical protein BRADI_5g14846v3 [Brachypodium distachyon]
MRREAEESDRVERLAKVYPDRSVGRETTVRDCSHPHLIDRLGTTKYRACGTSCFPLAL